MRLSVIGKHSESEYTNRCTGYRVIDIDSFETKDITKEVAYMAYKNRGIAIKGLVYPSTMKVKTKTTAAVMNIDKLEYCERIKENEKSNIYIYLKDHNNKSVLATCDGSITYIDSKELIKFCSLNTVIPLNHSGINITMEVRKTKITNNEFIQWIRNKNNRKLIAIGVSKSIRCIEGFKVYDINNEESIFAKKEDIIDAFLLKENIILLRYTEGILTKDTICNKEDFPYVNNEGKYLEESQKEIFIPINITDNTLKLINCNEEIKEIGINECDNYTIIGLSEGINKLKNKLQSSNNITIDKNGNKVYDTNSKTDTPMCTTELIYYFALKQMYEDAEYHKTIDDTEFTIFIPSRKLAIDYRPYLIGTNDGYISKKKDEIASKQGITLVKVITDYEQKKTMLNNYKIISKTENSPNDYLNVLSYLCIMLGYENNVIDIEKAYTDAYDYMSKLTIQNSISKEVSNNSSRLLIKDKKIVADLYKNTVDMLFIDKDIAKQLTVGSSRVKVELQCPLCKNKWETTMFGLFDNHKRFSDHTGQGNRKDDLEVKCRYCHKTVGQMIDILKKHQAS